MRLLLTGGGGFIGRNLLESLRANHEVLAPSHRLFDVTDTAVVDQLFQERRFDAVLHAAIQGGDRVLDSTLRGYWNLARHAGEVGRLFYFGSGAEYGKQRDLVKVSEKEIGRVVPGDDYGFAKFLCNDIARRSAKITNLRVFGVYGHGENYLFKLISNSVVKALLGVDLVIKQDVVFDYLFIDDLCAIVRELLECDLPYRDLNVTPTDSITLRRVAEIVAALEGGRVGFEFVNGGMNFEYTGHNGRLREILPAIKFTPYETAIKKLRAYYASRLETLDREAIVKDDYLMRATVRSANPTSAAEREPTQP